MGYTLAAPADSANLTVVTLVPALRASVTYTSPASASPLVTLVSTSETAGSSLTGVRCTPVLSSMRWVAAPQGAGSPHTTTLSPGLPRSAKEWICLGSPGGVTITNVSDAKLTGSVSVKPALATVSICALSVEAKMSAVAPEVNWVASSEEPAKSKFTLAPGLSAWNCPASSVNVAFSGAAANTTIDLPGDDGCDADGVLGSHADRFVTSTSDRTPEVTQIRARCLSRPCRRG